MREIITKATISSVAIDNTAGNYQRSLRATIDGANGLITLDLVHINTVATPAIDERSTFTITIEQLESLNKIISKL